MWTTGGYELHWLLTGSHRSRESLHLCTSCRKSVTLVKLKTCRNYNLWVKKNTINCKILSWYATIRARVSPGQATIREFNLSSSCVRQNRHDKLTLHFQNVQVWNVSCTLITTIWQWHHMHALTLSHIQCTATICSRLARRRGSEDGACRHHYSSVVIIIVA